MLETPSGARLVQTAAILRYVGRLAPPDLLYPADLERAAVVDGLLDQEADFFAGLSCMCARHTCRAPPRVVIHTHPMAPAGAANTRGAWALAA